MTHPMISVIARFNCGWNRHVAVAISFDRTMGWNGCNADEELHTMAGVNKLPVKELDDQSLVYPTVPKR